MYSIKARIGRLIQRLLLGLTKKLFGFKDKSITTKHGRVFYLHREVRDAPTLILIHGFSDIPEGFLASLIGLRKKYNLILPALKGFDKEGVKKGVSYSLPNYRDTIMAIADHHEIDSFFLGGNSLGGVTSLQIYKDHPERVEGLILINSAGFEFPEVDSLIKRSHEGENPFVVHTREDFIKFKDAIFHRKITFPFFIDDFLFEDFKLKRQDYEDISASLLMNDTNLSQGKHLIEPTEIKVRTLLIWGKSDDFFPHAIAEKVNALLPNGTLITLDQAGHVPQHEAPLKVQKAIKDFIN